MIPICVFFSGVTCVGYMKCVGGSMIPVRDELKKSVNSQLIPLQLIQLFNVYKRMETASLQILG